MSQNSLNDDYSSNKTINIKIMFKEWCELSTTHGIPQIARARNLFLKIMWLIFFIICLSICSYNITNTFIDFITYKVNVNIQTINEAQTDFPAVSFCNLNSFKTSDPNIKARIDAIIANKSLPKEDLDRANKKMKVINNILKQEALNEKKYGFNLTDLLISCFFKSYPCEKNDFEPFYDYEYGNCFRFNGNLINTKKTHANNPKGGLKLELYIGNNSFQSDIYTNKKGFRVLVHNQSQRHNNDYFIELENKGYDVMPGFETNLIVKRIFYDRYPKPNGKCVDDQTKNYKYQTKCMSKFFNDYKQNIYSQELCQKYALQSYLDQKCNCTEPSLKLNKSCILFEQVRCYENFFQMFDINSYEAINNECPLGKNLIIDLKHELKYP
jgi:hypothetical protein